MAKTCAYCDQHDRLTRDHVWPSCFIDRFGRDKLAHFSVKSKKVHGADYVVRDVCATCNAQRLGPLDSYFCGLYDKYFHELHDFDKTVVIEYDYALLSRALLKIAYNTSRSGITDPAPLAVFRRYIAGLETDSGPLAIFGELVAPTILQVTNLGGTVRKKLHHHAYRSALASFLGPGGEKVLLRVVAVNSFFFHVMVPLRPMMTLEFESIAASFEALLMGARRIEPLLDHVTLSTSPQDGLRSFFPHLEANYDAYRDHFSDTDIGDV